MTQMTYPISPSYVKNWTPVRGACELIANALDEDPDATVTYADGVLTITDNGPGIPEEGLILGYSPKGLTSIGQFGEGSKIAALVLARSEEIGRVVVETVGYAFTPTVETRTILDGIAPRRNDTPPQVLVYSFTTSTRTAGTRVTIECPQHVADEAMARFRHLSEPGYTAPTGTGEVILDGDPGRLFIGGVLVSVQPRLIASYDFPLAVAKTAQNRDRTVIDSEALTGLIGNTLSGCARRDVVEKFVTHALDGGRLAEPEKYFANVDDPRVKATFRTVGGEKFKDRSVFYSSGRGTEAELYLLDGDFELLTTNLDQSANTYLMMLLGVESAPYAARTNQNRSAGRTKYVPAKKLTAHERAVLAAAVKQVETVFGGDAVGTVKVYTDAANPALACADGFYTPATRGISLHRDALADPGRTLEVLVHEAAHRRAHTLGGEFADRTRGFESTLTTMLGAAVAALTADRAPAQGAVEGGAPEPMVAVLAEATPPPERAALAALIGDLLPGACEAAGVSGDAELSDSVALHRNYLRMLISPRPAGWRRPKGNMSPSMVADHRKHEVLGAALGIRPAVLWLGHMICEGPVYGRAAGAAAKPGPWPKRIQGDVAAVVAELAGYGGVYADAGTRLAALADGTAPSTGPVEEWAGFVVGLVGEERARLGLEDVAGPVAAHARTAN